MTELPSEPGPSAGKRSLLWRNRQFVFVLIGHVISTLGDGFHTVALTLWVLQTTGSATAMATVATVRVLVGVLLGAVAGTVSDRTDRRRLMIAMDLARTLLVLGLALALLRPGTFPLLVGLSALVAVASTFFGPAFGASLVQIVGKEQVGQATSLMQLINTLAQVAGPLLGGLVVTLTNGATAMVVDAVSFGVSALAIILGGAFASPRGQAQQRNSFWQDLREGLTYIRQRPLILALVTSAPMLNFFMNGLFVLLPVIAVQVWHVSAGEFGLLEALFPVGFAAGAAWVMSADRRLVRRGTWISVSLLTVGPLSLAVMEAPRFVWAVPMVLVAGVALAIVNILLQSAMAREVDPAVQGRVYGLISSLVSVASPVALMVGGMLSDWLSPSLVGWGMGFGLTLATVLVVLFFPAIRQYRLEPAASNTAAAEQS